MKRKSFIRAAPMLAAFSIAAVLMAVGLYKGETTKTPPRDENPVKELSTAIAGSFGKSECNSPGGQKALGKLIARIEPDARGLHIRVVNIGIVNAAALPGGQIFVFRGLLQEAKSPDEIAGVIAHEIGHVRKNHVRDAMARQVGLSLGFGSFGGGDANMLIATRYSRAAETEADAYSIRALRNGGISPEDMAGFFNRLGAQEKKRRGNAKIQPYLETHPLSERRERAFRASRRAGAAYSAALNRDEWDALIDICHNDADVNKG